MKKIFILISGFLMITMLNSCPGCCFTPPSPPYPLALRMSLRAIDPRVKTIKITLENLDGIEPQYSVSDNVNDEGFPIILKRYSKPEIIGEKKYYFQNLEITFTDRGVINSDKKHIYELKMYINDKLFFTKKFSFIHKGNNVFEDEFDNREYVLKNGDIEITDADIKKWLEKKK